MPEIHLRQPGFIFSVFGPFTKNKQRRRKLKKPGYLQHIFQNKLKKACFQRDMVYGDFRDLTRRTASDKILGDKTFNISNNQNMLDVKGVYLQWFII